MNQTKIGWIEQKRNTDSAGRAHQVPKLDETLPLDRTEADRRWQAGTDGHLHLRRGGAEP